METIAVFNPTYYENRYKLSAAELVNHTTQPLVQFCVKLQEGVNLVTKRMPQEKRAQMSQTIIRQFVDSNMARITDEQLQTEITLNSARTALEYDNLIKLAVQSYAMFLAITNSRKTKLCIDVPPYVTFFRRMAVAFIRNTLNQHVETQEVDLRSACKSGKAVSEELQNLVNAEISATVPIDKLIKQQFDTVSVCDEERDESQSGVGFNPNEREHVSFEPADGDPVKTLMDDGDDEGANRPQLDQAQDIFEGNTIDALRKDIHEEEGEASQSTEGRKDQQRQPKLTEEEPVVVASGTPTSSSAPSFSSPPAVPPPSPTDKIIDTQPKTTILISNLSVQQLANILREPHKYVKTTNSSLLFVPQEASPTVTALSSLSPSTPTVMTLEQLKQEKKRQAGILSASTSVQERAAAVGDEINSEDVTEGRILNTIVARQQRRNGTRNDSTDDVHNDNPLAQSLNEYVDAHHDYVGPTSPESARDDIMDLPAFETI